MQACCLRFAKQDVERFGIHLDYVQQYLASVCACYTPSVLPARVQQLPCAILICIYIYIYANIPSIWVESGVAILQPWAMCHKWGGLDPKRATFLLGVPLSQPQTGYQASKTPNPPPLVRPSLVTKLAVADHLDAPAVGNGLKGFAEPKGASGV